MMDQSAIDALAHLELHGDFMNQIEVIADMGAGDGEYAHWWATRTKEDGTPRKYMIMAIDNQVQVDNRYRLSNVRQVRADWSKTGLQKNRVELVWCYDSFQFAVDPYATLAHWWDIMREDAMLVIAVPQTAYIDDLSRWQVFQPAGCYHSWNMVTLIQALATSGFDCREGFLKMQRHDQMLWAAVYKSKHPPMDRAETTWYHLLEKKLLPVTAEECVMKLGYLRQELLTVEWLDHSRYNLAIESMP